MDHPHCYPGTDVYRNKENIRDKDELEAFERQHSADRLLTLPHGLPITVEGFARFTVTYSRTFTTGLANTGPSRPGVARRFARPNSSPLR